MMVRSCQKVHICDLRTFFIVLILFVSDSIANTQNTSAAFSTSKDFEMHNSLMSSAGSKLLMEVFCDHEELLLC